MYLKKWRVGVSFVGTQNYVYLEPKVNPVRGPSGELPTSMKRLGDWRLDKRLVTCRIVDQRVGSRILAQFVGLWHISALAEVWVKAHNIVIICTVALLLSAATVFADTIPGGDVSGTWYAANAPYYITGDITVPSGSALTIEPGVDVIFLGNYQFHIFQGSLEAIGTPTDSIRFFPQDTITGWQSLRFTTVNACHLTYCVVEHAYNSGIQLRASWHVYISHSRISHCRAGRGAVY